MASSSTPLRDFTHAEVMSLDDMIKNTIYYFLMMQGKSHVLRKSDIIKTAINKQAKDFSEVIIKVDEVLRKVFGSELVGMKRGSDDSVEECNLVLATSFMVVSQFRQRISAIVKPEQTFSKDLVKAALLLILSCMYMQDKTLDEDQIWNILEAMDFSQHLCKKREDLKRFLKVEYVEPLYLTKTEIRDTDQLSSRYEWGFRAKREISTFAMLKFVANVLGKKPEEFPVHMKKVLKNEMDSVNDEDKALKTTERSKINDDDGTRDQSSIYPKRKSSQPRRKALVTDSDGSSDGE